MHKFSPLLISMIVLTSLLAHHVHGPVAQADVTPVTITAAPVAERVHHGVKDLQVVQHGALSEISPELCTVGDPAPPTTSDVPGHVATLTPAASTAIIDATPSTASIWETPVIPPDVLRAFLQVFLN